MYKIVYNKFEGRLTSRLLNAALRSLPSRIQERSRELLDSNVCQQVHATGVGPAACACTAGESRLGRWGFRTS